jgi:hypothetical protein
VALAFVLLVASSLMIRTLLQVHAVDLGFEPERFVAVDASVRDRARMEAFYAALLDRVRGVPGVTAVGAVAGLPLGGLAITSGGFLRHPDGRPTSEPESGWDNRSFVPGYFETIGMRRVAGHWPSPAECAATPRPLVLSESAARRLFGPDPAVGQLLIASNESHRVAAVAADIRHRGPQEDPVFEIYFCRDDPVALIRASLTIVVRSDRQPSDLALPLRSAVLGIGERVSNIRIRSGSDLFSGVTAVPRHRTQLLSLLGGLGLVLAMVGVFGLTAYAVARRTREIGIRMAFGARRVDAVMVMIRDAAVAGAIGLALGLLVAFLGAPVLGAFLFQVPPRDPVAFGSAALVLACAGLVAAWIPARRAARVNPVEALRAE